MAYVLGQVNVSVTAATNPLFRIPAGLCNFTFYNSATVPCYIGTSTALTTTNGFLCPTVVTGYDNYNSSEGTAFYGVVASTASTASVNYMIITNQ